MTQTKKCRESINIFIAKHPKQTETCREREKVNKVLFDLCVSERFLAKCEELERLFVCQ